MNFLALLGWSYDDKTTIMSPAELVERFSLERVVPSPATFDYEKLDWMNGVYLRALPEDEYAAALLRWLARAGDRLAGGDGARDRAARAGEDREALAVPRLRALPLRAGRARTAPTPRSCRAAAEALAAVDPWETRADRGGAAGARRRASARSRARRSRRSASRSPARRSRRACSRASSCSAATSRSRGCAPPAG